MIKFLQFLVMLVAVLVEKAFRADPSCGVNKPKFMAERPGTGSHDG
jgi:hypothetical protein